MCLKLTTRMSFQSCKIIVWLFQTCPQFTGSRIPTINHPTHCRHNCQLTLIFKNLLQRHQLGEMLRSADWCFLTNIEPSIPLQHNACRCPLKTLSCIPISCSQYRPSIPSCYGWRLCWAPECPWSSSNPACCKIARCAGSESRLHTSNFKQTQQTNNLNKNEPSNFKLQTSISYFKLTLTFLDSLNFSMTEPNIIRIGITCIAVHVFPMSASERPTSITNQYDYDNNSNRVKWKTQSINHMFGLAHDRHFPLQ